MYTLYMGAAIERIGAADVLVRYAGKPGFGAVPPGDAEATIRTMASWRARNLALLREGRGPRGMTRYFDRAAFATR